MEDGATTETQRHRAAEEGGWLVSNTWLTIITTPPPVFCKCSFQRVLSSLEATLAEVLLLNGFWERRVCLRVILVSREGVGRLEGLREAPCRCALEFTQQASMKRYFCQHLTYWYWNYGS